MHINMYTGSELIPIFRTNKNEKMGFISVDMSACLLFVCAVELQAFQPCLYEYRTIECLLFLSPSVRVLQTVKQKELVNKVEIQSRWGGEWLRWRRRECSGGWGGGPGDEAPWPARGHEISSLFPLFLVNKSILKLINDLPIE